MIEFNTSGIPSSITSTSLNTFEKPLVRPHRINQFTSNQLALEEIAKTSNWFDQDRIDYHCHRFQDAFEKQLNIPDRKEKQTTILYLLDIIRLKYIFPYSRLLALFTYFYIVTIKNLFK